MRTITVMLAVVFALLSGSLALAQDDQDVGEALDDAAPAPTATPSPTVVPAPNVNGETPGICRWNADATPPNWAVIYVPTPEAEELLADPSGYYVARNADGSCPTAPPAGWTDATDGEADEPVMLSLCVFRPIDDTPGQEIGQLHVIRTTEAEADAVLANYAYGFVLGGGDADCPTEGRFVLVNGEPYPFGVTPTPTPPMTGGDRDLVEVCQYVPAKGSWGLSRVPAAEVEEYLALVNYRNPVGRTCPFAPPTDATDGEPWPPRQTNVSSLPSTGIGVAGMTTLPLGLVLTGASLLVGTVAVSLRRTA